MASFTYLPSYCHTEENSLVPYLLQISSNTNQNTSSKFASLRDVSEIIYYFNGNMRCVCILRFNPILTGLFFVISCCPLTQLRQFNYCISRQHSQRQNKPETNKTACWLPFKQERTANLFNTMLNSNKFSAFFSN